MEDLSTVMNTLCNYYTGMVINYRHRSYRCRNRRFYCSLTYFFYRKITLGTAIILAKYKTSIFGLSENSWPNKRRADSTCNGVCEIHSRDQSPSPFKYYPNRGTAYPLLLFALKQIAMKSLLRSKASFQKNEVACLQISTWTRRWLKWFCFLLAHMLFLKEKSLRTL